MVGNKRKNDWTTRVMNCLRKSNGPMSAYDVLADLRQFNPKIAPPTVYRALTKLSEQGEIHRIESLNAYIACQCDHHSQASILSVCDDCGSIEESIAPQVLKAISNVVKKSGFRASKQVIELRGQCLSCHEGSAA